MKMEAYAVDKFLVFFNLIRTTVTFFVLVVSESRVHLWNAFTHIEDGEYVTSRSNLFTDFAKRLFQRNFISRLSVDNHLLVMMGYSMTRSDN